MISPGVTCHCSSNRSQWQPSKPPPSPRSCWTSWWSISSTGPWSTGGVSSPLFHNGQSTQRTYKSGKDWYLRFCLQAGMRSIPTCEQVLCCFVAHLANEHLKYRTIKVYLAAVWHIAVAQPDCLGGPCPWQSWSTYYGVLRRTKQFNAKGRGSSCQSRLLSCDR